MLQDVVVTIHHQDARIHRIQNLLVIFLPIHLLLSRMLQEELDSVEGLMQNLILLKPLLRRKIEGEIPIIYCIKKEGYLLDVAAIVAVEANGQILSIPLIIAGVWSIASSTKRAKEKNVTQPHMRLFSGKLVIVVQSKNSYKGNQL